MDPIEAVMDHATGLLTPRGPIVERQLSDMRGYYLDAEAEAWLVGAQDPVIYHVFPLAVPEEPGQVLCGTTVIYPGKVGDEYFMTKGHFHANPLSAEVYHTLRGEGYLLIETHDRATRHIDMRGGSIAYIPPGWAHRTVNTSDEPLVFFYAMPGDAGHDYAAIAERGGFEEVVVERDGTPRVLRRKDLA